MSPRSTHSLAIVALLVIYAVGAWVRIEGTLGDPGLDTRNATGMMRSDPGLVYYFTQRIVDAGGLPPKDFRHDQYVEWPEGSDVPAMFSVGQEFLVAWAWRLFGGEGSLHAFAAIVMSVIAAAAVFGVYGIAWEASRSITWGLLAAGLFTVLPFNYRTVGLILQREDLSMPLFALAAWAVVRGARRESRAAWIAAGVLATLSLATWHAMGFFASLVVASLWVVFLVRGRSPFRARHSAWVPAIVAGGCLAVPVLRSKALLLSPAMLGCVALVVTARFGEGRARLTSFGIALGSLALLVGIAFLARAVGWAGQEDYGHVLSFLLAKLRFLGVPPDDPSLLPFDARLLWQGPFVTATSTDFKIGLGGANGLALLVLAFGTWGAWRRPEARGPLLATVLLGIGLAAAWLVRRTMILPALLIGPSMAIVFTQARGKRAAQVVTGVVLALQASFFFQAIGETQQTWYQPGAFVADVRHMAEWVERNVPEGEAILGDFVCSTSVLSNSRHPIVLQPKYETSRSRERIERFYQAWTHGSWSEMAALMREWDCRYLLVDRHTLWSLRYVLGVPFSQVVAPTGTPAFDSQASPPRPLPRSTGFRLIYRTPQASPTDSMRIYVLED